MLMKWTARRISVFAGIAALSTAAAACGGGEQGGGVTTSATSAATTASAATTSAAITSAAPVASASASAAPSAAPEASGSSAAAPPKTFDCGARGQKPCPMQGWMKTVMANAASSGNGEKLAKALTYCATHVPPGGYDDWATMATAGAKKAKAGDVEGAKRSCKACHDAYKERYKATLRDQPY